MMPKESSIATDALGALKLSKMVAMGAALHCEAILHNPSFPRDKHREKSHKFSEIYLYSIV